MEMESDLEYCVLSGGACGCDNGGLSQTGFSKRKRKRSFSLRAPYSLRLFLLCSLFWNGISLICTNAQHNPGDSHRIQKRIAILPSGSTPSSLLVPLSHLPRGRSSSSHPTPNSNHNQNEEDNQIDTFASNKDSRRDSNAIRGKVTFPVSPLLVLHDREPPTSFRFPQESESPSYRDSRNLDLKPVEPTAPDIFNINPAESGRKASPDVQDIIDGIVKLLGGKVHNTQQTQPTSNPTVTQPQLIPSNRPYNLFNPTKPIFYPTPKPARINNRGPVLPVQHGQFSQHSTEQQHQQLGPVQQHQQQQPAPAQQQHFEAIPLEALNLNNNYNLNHTKFGPPFTLTHHEAPYKQGVPLPVQKVPGSHVGNPNYGYNNNRQQQKPQQQHHSGESNNYYPLSSAELQNYNRQKLIGQGQSRPSSSENVYKPQNQQNSNGHGQISLGTTKQYGSNQHQQNQNQPLRNPQPTATSLLVPVPVVPKATSPLPPLQAQLQTDSIEDDEVDAEKAVSQSVILDKNTRKPFGLEPTLNDESQLPAFISESATSAEVATSTSTVYQFSSVASSFASISPTSSSSVYATGLGSSSSTAIREWNTGSSTSTSTLAPKTTQQPLTYPPLNAAGQAISTSSTPAPVPTLRPNKTPVFNPNNIGIGTSTSLGAISTPPLRPGIVIHEENPSTNPLQLRPGTGSGRPLAFGSVEVVTTEDQQNNYGNLGKPGDVFDITVTAKQNYGGQATGQPFVIPVDIKDEIITAPNGHQQFVSIDGKRTYFNLHPSTASGIAIGSATPALVPQVQGTVPPSSVPPVIKSHPGIVGVPSHPFTPAGSVLSNTEKHTPSRAVSTSLSITGSGGTTHGGNLNVGTTLKINDRPSTGSKTPPNIIRRPLNRRPSVPPVRIDTCIVGDDSTCNSEQFESCRTENGVSSCLCRPGYARKRHREPCKAVVSLVLSIRLDKLGDKKLSYNPDYFNPNSEVYQSLEWETIHGLDSAMSDTTLHGSYIGAKLDAIGFDGRHAVVNSTVLLQENPKMQNSQVKREIQRQLIDVLTKNRNNFGKSQLWVEGPISAINAIADLDECSNPELTDCDVKADCVNTYGSFECKCFPGYGDRFEKDKRRSGRNCESCNGKTHCNGRGECLIENGQNVCKCAGNYYGSQCDIDGEVLAVAIGASVSALVIIGLTLACLCMWSRRWKREEQKAAIMSRTLFGGMASQALSYLSKNTMSNPYQQHVTMDERLRWAQVTDPNLNGNIYVNEPMSLHASPTHMGSSLMDTPPMMSARRSADTCDTTIDDLFEERHHMNKRPKSRSSQSQIPNGSIYYDLEGEPPSEIYATRQAAFPYPAQFCVPMNPYPHSRGFYN